jgi:hypothetical protein
MEVADVEAHMRGLEQTFVEREQRLKQLMELRLPTNSQLNEALELSSSLQLLDVQVRRLRLQIVRTPTS